MCDHTPWGVDMCKRVGSPRFKLLYDIYHMQIMEGDVIRTIGDNWDYIAHYHTGGVPGRNEIDETQELQWKTIATVRWPTRATRATSRTSSSRSATRSRRCVKPCGSAPFRKVGTRSPSGPSPPRDHAIEAMDASESRP